MVNGQPQLEQVPSCSVISSSSLSRLGRGWARQLLPLLWGHCSRTGHGANVDAEESVLSILLESTLTPLELLLNKGPLPSCSWLLQGSSRACSRGALDTSTSMWSMDRPHQHRPELLRDAESRAIPDILNQKLQ